MDGRGASSGLRASLSALIITGTSMRRFSLWASLVSESDDLL